MGILEVRDVSIRYITGDFKDIGLKEYMMKKLKGEYHVTEFWADRNISFTLDKGEMLGIIGTNGAGKSTLLKAVSGIMEPTAGYVKREGNIAALLELASGFDGDLTVRENAYLRGAMLGYTRKFMDETYDQIIDFAELRDFQDRPFRQLSSGMKSRLAFSIASLVQPDILILDEVLSVGDGAFRKKSEEKMREIIANGATTILVSHSISQVREMCHKVLWLEKGRQIAFGDTAELCDMYQQYLDHTITLEEVKYAFPDGKDQSGMLGNTIDSESASERLTGIDSAKEKRATGNKGAFSKQNSLAVKGVAIFMMMWHHCFLPGRFDGYTINFFPLAQSQVVNIAMFCKICVSLFAFISGYGLFISYQKLVPRERNTTRWVYEKLVRTLSNYWFVVLLMWVICAVLDGRPYLVYGFSGSKYAGIWTMLIDFFGLSNFFGCGTLSEDWWYISAMIIFVMLLPAIFIMFHKIGCFVSICAICIFSRMCAGYPGGTNFLSFLPTFCIGMVFAKHDLFSRWTNGKLNVRAGMFRRFLLCLALLLCYKLYYHLPNNIWWDIKWGVIPVVVILFIYDVLVPIPPINAALVFAGRHTTNIWLIHTFIRLYYCQDFIYGRGNFAVIIAVLFLTSLAASLVVELLKKIIRYDCVIKRFGQCRRVVDGAALREEIS